MFYVGGGGAGIELLTLAAANVGRQDLTFGSGADGLKGSAQRFTAVRVLSTATWIECFEVSCHAKMWLQQNPL